METKLQFVGGPADGKEQTFHKHVLEGQEVYVPVADKGPEIYVMKRGALLHKATFSLI